jgi:hypothetical protein
MLKRTITFKDFDENEVTEVHYFNISNSELIELNVGYEGGAEGFFMRLVESGDGKNIIEEFKKLILFAYGKRSEDGRRFIKNDEIRTEFSQTLAFDALFMDLATNLDSAAQFVNGVIPKDLAAKVKAMTPQDKPTGPPMPPSKV